ncbi:MAG: hypothetical protein IJX84_07470 [Clostridia bacterium]|nr:hypothetical protein [Clostridia bacterium]
MLTGLRQAVQEQLAQVPAKRKPALRRTDDPRALLMCDLPRIADEAAVMSFVAALEAEGWRVWQETGWLLLDHAVPASEMVWPEAYTGESGCCLWLLRQHPGDAPAEAYIRALVKAAEVGRQRVEWLCSQWHGEFAARLREHLPLPGGLAPYLAKVMKEEEK